MGSGRRSAWSQARGHGHPVDRALALVLLVGGAGQIAPDDALDGEHLGPAHEHRAAGQPVQASGQGGGAWRELGDVGTDEVVGGEVGERLQPEGGHGREDPPLLRDGLGHDHVEGGDAVGGHHQQPVSSGVVELPHLARLEEREGFGSGGGHGASSSRASVKRWTWRSVRARSKASSSWAAVRVTSGSSSRTARRGRRSSDARRASRWTMR